MSTNIVKIIEYMELPSIERARIGKTDAVIVVEIAPGVVHRVVIPEEELLDPKTADQRIIKEIQPYLERRKIFVGKTLTPK